ncbi:MAG: hypothetical protein AAFR52_03310 [Pseudomonadota bacterium]
MSRLLLLALGLTLAACASSPEGGSNVLGQGASEPLVASPSGKEFFRGDTGRVWPPRGRPNR